MNASLQQGLVGESCDVIVYRCRMSKRSFHKCSAIMKNVMKPVVMHVAIKLESFAENAHISLQWIF